MKKNILLYITFFFLVLNAYAQEAIKPFKVIKDIRVDQLGNAHCAFSMVLDAANWDNFKKNAGESQNSLKRYIERLYPTSFLTNFNYVDSPMLRKYVLSFDVLGFCSINQNGLWQLDINDKNPDITKLTDNVYTLTSEFDMGGGLEQDVNKITFPSNASQVKQDKNAFGKAIFTYSLHPGGFFGGNLLYLIGGILLLVAGGLLLFVRLKSK